MSVTWDKLRDNTELALVIAAVLTMGSTALGVGEIKTKLTSMAERIQRIEQRQDRHIESHNPPEIHRGDGK